MIWSDQEIKLLLTTRIFYTDVMNELFFLRESQATINIVIHLFEIRLNAALRISFFFFFFVHLAPSSSRLGEPRGSAKKSLLSCLTLRSLLHTLMNSVN